MSCSDITVSVNGFDEFTDCGVSQGTKPIRFHMSIECDEKPRKPEKMIIDPETGDVFNMKGVKIGDLVSMDGESITVKEGAHQRNPCPTVQKYLESQSK
jgi:flagellar basal body P-ring protein FlgI